MKKVDKDSGTIEEQDYEEDFVPEQNKQLGAAKAFISNATMHIVELKIKLLTEFPRDYKEMESWKNLNTLSEFLSEIEQLANHIPDPKNGTIEHALADLNERLQRFIVEAKDFGIEVPERHVIQLDVAAAKERLMQIIKDLDSEKRVSFAENAPPEFQTLKRKLVKAKGPVNREDENKKEDIFVSFAPTEDQENREDEGTVNHKAKAPVVNHEEDQANHEEDQANREDQDQANREAKGPIVNPEAEAKDQVNREEDEVNHEEDEVNHEAKDQVNREEDEVNHEEDEVNHEAKDQVNREAEGSAVDHEDEGSVVNHEEDQNEMFHSFAPTQDQVNPKAEAKAPVVNREDEGTVNHKAKAPVVNREEGNKKEVAPTQDQAPVNYEEDQGPAYNNPNQDQKPIDSNKNMETMSQHSQLSEKRAKAIIKQVNNIIEFASCERLESILDRVFIIPKDQKEEIFNSQEYSEFAKLVKGLQQRVSKDLEDTRKRNALSNERIESLKEQWHDEGRSKTAIQAKAFSMKSKRISKDIYKAIVKAFMKLVSTFGLLSKETEMLYTGDVTKWQDMTVKAGNAFAEKHNLEVRDSRSY